MRKSTVLFSATIVFLIAIIGVGIWAANNNQPPKPSQDMSEQTKSFTMSDVSHHKSKDDCWTVISGDVYNLTDFVNRHPGGDEILRACGTDATTLFNSRQTSDGQPVGSGSPHSQTAIEQLSKLKIGTLIEER